MSSLFAILTLLTAIVSAQMTTSYLTPSAISTMTDVYKFSLDDGSTSTITVSKTMYEGGQTPVSTIPIVTLVFSDNTVYANTIGTSLIFAGGQTAISTVPIVTLVFSDSTVYADIIGSSTIFPVPSATSSSFTFTSTIANSSSSVSSPTATSLPSATVAPKSGTNKTAIGLGVGLGLGIPLLAGLLWFCYRRRPTRTPGEAISGPELSQGRGRPGVEQVANPLDYQPYRQH